MIPYHPLFPRTRESRGLSLIYGRFTTNWYKSPGDSWTISRYRSGKWEDLVEPTLKLAKWLESRDGLADTVNRDFRQSIKSFHSTGQLVLPETIGSFPDTSALGSIISGYPADFRNWDERMLREVEKGLLSYIASDADQAGAWHALSIVYSIESRFRDCVNALDKAISIAPDQVQFHHETASFYLSAIQLSLVPEMASKLLGPTMRRCTLDALGCSYQEAKATCKRHLEAVLVLSRSRRDNRAEKAEEALQWLDAGAGGYERHNARDRSLPVADSDGYRIVRDETESSFCDYLTAGALRELLDTRTASGWRVEMDVAINLTVLQLLLGMSMARRYPDKARNLLVRERLPSPPGGLDLRLLHQHTATLKGLRGEEALFSSIEQDFKANFDRYARQGQAGSWILTYVLMRLMPPSSLNSLEKGSDIDADLLAESLFGAMKDGIAYILFLPEGSHLEEFENELKKYYVGGTELVDASLDQALDIYEQTYGTI